MKLLVQDLAMIDDLEIPQDTSGTHLLWLPSSKHFIEKLPYPAGNKRLQAKCKVCADRGRTKQETSEEIYNIPMQLL